MPTGGGQQLASIPPAQERSMPAGGDDQRGPIVPAQERSMPVASGPPQATFPWPLERSRATGGPHIPAAPSAHQERSSAPGGSGFVGDNKYIGRTGFDVDDDWILNQARFEEPRDQGEIRVPGGPGQGEIRAGESTPARAFGNPMGPTGI